MSASKMFGLSFVVCMLFLVLSGTAFGLPIIDPVGFCPPPATVAACTTGTGLGGHTIAVGTTTFGMEKNGSGGSVSPWYMLIAVPDSTIAPTITSNDGFTPSPQTGQLVGQMLRTTPAGTSIYDIASVGLGVPLTGDSSMNAPNMFCDGAGIPCASSNEISAHGSLPTFFDIFAYTFTPSFDSQTPYSFSVGGSGLIGGTYLAATGGSNPFSTPFTTTGLACCTDRVPEPGTLLLLGAGIAGVAAFSRKKLHR